MKNSLNEEEKDVNLSGLRPALTCFPGFVTEGKTHKRFKPLRAKEQVLSMGSKRLVPPLVYPITTSFTPMPASCFIGHTRAKKQATEQKEKYTRVF